MKRLFLFSILSIITLLKTGSLYAQQPYFLAEKTKGIPKYMIRITEKDTTLYHFGWQYGKMGYDVAYYREQQIQSRSLKYDPILKGYYYRPESEKWKERKKILFVQQPDSIALPYFRRAAWMEKYVDFDREMDTLFPMHGLNYYHSYGNYEDSAVSFEAIPQWTTEKIAALRDQTIRTYAPLDSCYQHITGFIQTISYEETRAGFRLLASEFLSYGSPGYRYFDALLSHVAKNRPEMIFQLEKDLPEQRDEMIRLLTYDKSGLKSLKTADKKAPFTRVVLKERRKNVFLGTLGATLGLAVDGAVIYGIVWLIRR